MAGVAVQGAQLLLSSGARTDSSEVLSRFPPTVEKRGRSPLPDGEWVVRGSWGLLKAEVRLGTSSVTVPRVGCRGVLAGL